MPKGTSMAGSKPTAVHFSLVFFVMTTLILGIAYYLTTQEQQKSAVAAKEARDAEGNAQRALSNAVSEIEALKQLMGYEGLTEVGVGGNNENSVLAAARRDLNSFGREQVQPSQSSPKMKDTLQALRAALETMTEQSKSYNVGVQQTGARLLAEQTAYRNREQQVQDSQQQSEQQLQRLVTDQTEKIAQKDREIARVRQDLASERVAKEQVSDELERVRRETSEQLTMMEKANENLRIQLNDLENLSFDKPDGQIVRVDNITRRVWIDLGSKDYLRPQITFSVYTQDHRGVGRGPQDIKAKIEVVKITNVNLAECRIIQEDFDRPIQAGDPIHTPLFTPGAVEFFSFVGTLDMNGDGKSDRELLHDILANAGAEIEIEIDDQGFRIPEDRNLSVKSKFLVVGEIPDISNLAGFDERKEEVQRMMDENNALRRSAIQQGIRIITFRDFLSYIGYENKQRLFTAGENMKYTLKSGARSTGTDEVIGANRISTGNTSARFKTDRSQGSSSSR